MSGAVPVGLRERAVSLAGIQAPVRERLERVQPELHRIVVHGLPMIEAVSGHLLQMRGKMFRPTLSLLASDIEGRGDDRVITLAAAIELMHLATLVHDDSVDHSVLRRGQPTVNALFSHQVSVIMGDFLYSRALQAMVSLESLEIMRILTEVSNELAVGEMRQLSAIEALEFDEEGYVALIRSKTGSLLSASCETGTFFGAGPWPGMASGWGSPSR
jgi:octaprenyl-diphosphate synthase